MVDAIGAAFVAFICTHLYYSYKRNEEQKLMRQAIKYTKEFGLTTIRCVGFMKSATNGFFFLMEENAENDPSKKVLQRDREYTVSDANKVLFHMPYSVCAEIANEPYSEFFSERIKAKK